MKYFLTICFSFVLSLLSAQEITYTPVFINQFTGETIDFVIFSICKDSTCYQPKMPFHSNTVYLKEKGVYTFYYSHIGELLTSEQMVIINESKIDTFFYPKVSTAGVEMFPKGNQYYEFNRYEGESTGEIVDYYYNGNLRFTGKFKDGIAVGDLKLYYPNGSLKVLSKTQEEIVYKYSADGILQAIDNHKQNKYEKYSPDGNLQSIDNYKRKIFEKYYPNGQLKQVEKRGKWRVITKKYDKNGELKSVQKVKYKDIDSRRMI